jgi:hypothetical protein
MRAKPYLKTRFAIRPGDGHQGDHSFGGTDNYDLPQCRKCKSKVILLCDIDCHDPALKKALRGKLKGIDRLPLIHCMGCMCEMSYAIRGRKIRIVKTRYGNSTPSPLYHGYPKAFERKKVWLDPTVPDGLREVINKWDPDVDLRGNKLKKSERKLLEDFCGHPVFVPRFIYHHQIGGMALCDGWDKPYRCPNSKCLNEKHDGRPMRFLAGILNDPPAGLPLIEPLDEKTKTQWNYFVSFFYQICDKCLTITTNSASD